MNPVIVANWKMNLTKVSAIAHANHLKMSGVLNQDVTVIIAPPSCYLSDVAMVLNHTHACICAQTVSEASEGAYTGEVSASMMSDCGATHALVGHSERRVLFHETNDALISQLNQCKKTGLIPIICVGEALDQRQKRNDILTHQLSIIQAVDGPFMIAYEPVWAIGTGVPASPSDAQQAHECIRKIVGNECPILYGGSVNASNTHDIMKQSEINGVLVGGASLDPAHFCDIINASKRSEI